MVSNRWVVAAFEAADVNQRRMGVRLDQSRFKPKKGNKRFGSADRRSLLSVVAKRYPFKPAGAP
jgi:hypothetical protein